MGDQWHLGPAGFAQGKAYLFHGSASGIVVVAARSFEDCPTSFCDFGRNVAGEGDVNGDGFSDVIIGAFKHTVTAGFEGAVFVHRGNGGRGVPVRPLQAAGFVSTTPLALLGATGTWYTPSLDLHSPAGRTRVSLEFESKLFGLTFDGPGVFALPAAETVLTPRGSVSYAYNPGDLIHWRARLRSKSPLFGRSHWVSLPGNAPRELDVRVVPEPGFAAGFAASLGGLALLARRRARRVADPARR